MLHPRLNARAAARHVAVLVAHFMLVAAVYGPTRRLGFTSDAWVVLLQMRGGFRKALTSTLGYHYVPVASALMQACWRAFGLWATPWQVLSLIQFAVTVHLVYQVGRRLLSSSGLAFLASVLFIGNAFFHEVTYWPINGNIHSLAQSLYLLGIIIVLDMKGTEADVRRHWLFAALTLFAVFTYEGMVTMIPVAATILALRRLADESGGWRRVGTWWSQVARPLAPCAIVVLLLALAKSRFAQDMATATDLDLSLQRLYWAVRGLFGLFSLRGSHEVLHRMLTLGRDTPGVASPFVIGWFLFGCAGLVGIFWRERRQGPRILACWLAIHVLVLAAMVPMSSRHGYLPAVPAALLSVWALEAVARRMSIALRWEVGPERMALIVAVPVLALVLMAQRDHQTARAVWGEASDASAETAALVRTLAPQRREPLTVCFVNMPGILAKQGMGAFTFSNGLTDLAHLEAGRRVERVVLSTTYGAGGTRVLANDSAPHPITEIESWARMDDRIVIYYDPSSRRVRALTPTTASRPDRHLYETSPFLDWQPGAWWWLPLAAHRALEIPLLLPGPEAWVAIRYFQQPGMRLTLSAEGRQLMSTEASAIPGNWTVATGPLPRSLSSGAPLQIVSSAATQVAHVWSFMPQATIDALHAPFLWWADVSPPFVVVAAPLDLPLDTSGCGPCRLRIRYSGEETRVARAIVGAEAALSLGPHDGWNTVEASFQPTSRSTVLRLEPAGTMPMLLAGIQVDPVPTGR